MLACGAAGQTLRIQNLLDEEKESLTASHKFVVQKLRFLSKRTLLSADVGGQVVAWDLTTSKPLATWNLLADVPNPTDPNRQFPKMTIAAGGAYLAASDGAAERIHVWDLAARKKIVSLAGPKFGDDTALTIGPGGKLAYVVMDRAKKEEAVVLYDLPAEKETAKFKLPPPADAKLHRFGFPELAISADGRLLAAAIQHNVAGKVGTEVCGVS